MIFYPFVIAVIPVLLWNFLYKRGWYSPSLRADEPIVNAVFGLFGMSYAIITGFMFTDQRSNMGKLRKAVRMNIEEDFLEIVENRNPTTSKFVLFAIAFVIMGWVIIFHYESYWIGFASVYSVGYILTLIWEVIVDFDDPIHGMWVVKNIPPAWIAKANIKTRFSDRFFE